MLAKTMPYLCVRDRTSVADQLSAGRNGPAKSVIAERKLIVEKDYRAERTWT